MDRYFVCILLCIGERLLVNGQMLVTSKVAVVVTASSQQLPITRWNINHIVDGNSNTDADNCNCCGATGDDMNSWYQVDLGKEYILQRIHVIGRAHYKHTLYKMEIKLGKTDLNEIVLQGVNTSNISLRELDYTLNPLQVARFVTLMLSGIRQYFVMCELYVYAFCTEGTYGQDCENTCGKCQNSKYCNGVTGECSECITGYQSPLCQDCISGRYGPICNEECGNCINNEICDKVNGNCPSVCSAGFKGKMCKEACNYGKYGMTCAQTCGKCENGQACDNVNVCTEGTYGQDCENTCGKCQNSKYCNGVTGECSECITGYQSHLCQDCISGRYGPICNEECGNCINNEICDKVNGNCPSVCSAGFKGKMCKEACNYGKYGMTCAQTCGKCENGQACDNVNGTCRTCVTGYRSPMCKDCRDGRYGTACYEECGYCYNNDTCDKLNGYCPNGCFAGYQGNTCKKECEYGTFGPRCQHRCGNCSNNENCNNIDGSCASCTSGYKGHTCVDECQDGTFGVNCKHHCGMCLDGDVCDKYSGECPNGCTDEYKGSQCSQKINQDTCTSSCSDIPISLPIFIGSLFAVVIMNTTIVLGLVWLFYRKRLDKKTHKAANNEDTSIPLPNTSINYDTLRFETRDGESTYTELNRKS